MEKEPHEAFPYTPPDASLRTKYGDVFSIIVPPKERWVKLAFDKMFAMLALGVASPILCVIFAAHFVLALFIPDQRGRLLIRYTAVSQGKSFSKYKFRVVKDAYIDKTRALHGDWHAYSAEWIPESRTYLGVFLKMVYLDELPQLFNILFGHMSTVGPRPLAAHHYERDLEQGNIFRKLVKAGLFGPSQALKGTDGFGNPEKEYEYVSKYLKLSGLKLLWYDLTIIAGGLRVVFQANGL